MLIIHIPIRSLISKNNFHNDNSKFQGDQMSDVFKYFPDIVLNFTMLSLIKDPSTLHLPQFPQNSRLNVSLAADSIALLDYAAGTLNDRNVTSVASGLSESLQNVSNNRTIQKGDLFPP